MLLPGGGFAFHADYAHEGADLVITGADGAKVVIVDYFAAGEPADLMTLDGHLLPGDLVESLAGPRAPGQYAQESQTADFPAAATEIGTVEEVQGTVTATGADGLKLPLSAGSSVFQGDVLETPSDGAVNIVFIDGTTFSLGGDAKMVLDELIYDASSDTGSSLMSVVTGTFVFITGQVAKTGPDAMQVRTPSGTIGIRGTKVGCNLEVADGQTICVLLPEADGEAGEFVFSNESGSQGVSNAYDAIIANAYTATLTVSSVLPSQAAALLQGLLPGVLQTEAPPVVLSQGGTFSEFVTNQGNASFGLQTSGVLDDQDMTPGLTGGTVPDPDANALGVAASLFIAEPS
ncbi:MAG: FecR family protein, partial [Kiloniellales bacterium]